MFLPLARRISSTKQLYPCRVRFYTLPSPQHSIYVSNATDPYFNLTLEDWLFRHKTPEEPLLLLYRDEPCVVIGRNQNPWKEINFKALMARPDIPFIRRRSGGGTVYHDLGNTNFSIHLPRHSFDRHATAKVVLRAVQSLGINAQVNDRNDICVGKDKVSGSAYKIVNKRAYHHGTMLISTRLDTLGDLLHSTKDTMVTKGVTSVRSPVCNLQRFNRNVSHSAFVEAVIREFQKEYNIDAETQFIEDTSETRSIDYIRQGLQELPSWDWAFGQTPEFTYTVSNSFRWGNVKAEIRSKHGIILSCVLRLSDTQIDRTSAEAVIRIGRSLEGRRYGATCVEDKGVTGESSETPEADIATWLSTVMLF